MITASQCRAARALLDWSQQQLASAAQVGVVTVRQFEGGGAQPRPATLDVVTRALEAAGVEFIAENGSGPGVRLKKGSPVGSKAVLDDTRAATARPTSTPARRSVGPEDETRSGPEAIERPRNETDD